MRARFAIVLSTLVLTAVAAAAQTDQPATPAPTQAQTPPQTQAQPQPQPPAQPAQPDPVPGTPSVTVLGSQEVQGILGREVRSTADENMGRIVDVLVDSHGQTRAAIIDFGGFLGVGSRRIAVEWKALHFVPAADKRYGIVLELTRDQVKPAPEYKDGKPIVILGASGNLEPLP
jgi:PRC-barrel domain